MRWPDFFRYEGNQLCKGWQDTISCFRNIKRTLLLALFSAIIGWPTLFIIAGTEQVKEEILVTFALVLLPFGVIFVVVLLWNIFLAPSRLERNNKQKAKGREDAIRSELDEVRALLKGKPRLVFLPDMARLFTTIAEAKLATVDETENIENIKLKKGGNVIFQDPGMWDKLERIQQRFDYACESLERETYAAGSVFEPILKPLFVYMRSAAKLDSSTANEYKIKLEEMVMITRNKIEELSQPVPDKGDSQI